MGSDPLVQSVGDESVPTWVRLNEGQHQTSLQGLRQAQGVGDTNRTSGGVLGATQNPGLTQELGTTETPTDPGSRWKLCGPGDVCQQSQNIRETELKGR